jgi:hypothetical protein
VSARGAGRTLAQLVLLLPPLVAAGGLELHGANAAFAGPGVAIAWGVLQGPTEAETVVVIRIAGRADAYRYVSVEAVDPFSQSRRMVLASQPLAGTVDVRSPRASFAEFPRREVRLYRTADDARAKTPALTVYYLGVPDTTPEFPTEPALDRYLAAALARLAVAP